MRPSSPSRGTWHIRFSRTASIRPTTASDRMPIQSVLTYELSGLISGLQLMTERRIHCVGCSSIINDQSSIIRDGRQGRIRSNFVRFLEHERLRYKDWTINRNLIQLTEIDCHNNCHNDWMTRQQLCVPTWWFWLLTQSWSIILGPQAIIQYIPREYHINHILHFLMFLTWWDSMSHLLAKYLHLDHHEAASLWPGEKPYRHFWYLHLYPYPFSKIAWATPCGGGSGRNVLRM